jgi:hypothetical protein
MEDVIVSWNVDDAVGTLKTVSAVVDTYWPERGNNHKAYLGFVNAAIEGMQKDTKHYSGVSLNFDEGRAHIKFTQHSDVRVISFEDAIAHLKEHTERAMCWRSDYKMFEIEGRDDRGCD